MQNKEVKFGANSDRASNFYTSFIIKIDMMNKSITLSNGTSERLLQNIGDYIKFVSQVLHDENFLIELNKAMPFDKMISATMNVGANGGIIKKMGISVMRMDIKPSLYSLAITFMFKGNNGIMQNHSIFINACKTIKELQQLVTEENFKKEILILCEKRILGKQMALAD